MFGSIGPLEIGILLLVILVVFGHRRLPDVGTSIGRTLREFKQAVTGSGDREGDDGGAALSARTSASLDEPAKAEARPTE